MSKKYLLCITFMSFALWANAQKVALIKYGGGGDWYANPTSLPNLIAFCNKNLGTHINPKPEVVEPSSPDIFNYPFCHMTGHGNVIFTQEERVNLRKYLESGGFLHIDDNYGMAPYIRREIKKLFPHHKLKELPDDHPIFSSYHRFKNGLPKIHEHDGKPAQAFGITLKGRLVLLFTYESDLGDGWEDQAVHKDPQSVRLKALRMGANIIKYVFEH